MNGIGIFDSGVGGLTVLKAMIDLLPEENYIYYCDAKNLPYGEKSPEQIRKLSYESFKIFEKNKVKASIIACNTATTYSEAYLKTKFNFPILGVVSSGVMEGFKNSKNKKIALIATKATVEGQVYQDQLKKLDPSFEIRALACPDLVTAIEMGHVDDKKVEEIIKKYLDQLDDFDYDTLILGCTHFPLAIGKIKEYLKNKKAGKKINLIDPALETAKSMKDFLKSRNIIEKNKNIKFLTSGEDSQLREMLGKLFGQEFVNKIQIEIID